MTQERRNNEFLTKMLECATAMSEIDKRAQDLLFLYEGLGLSPILTDADFDPTTFFLNEFDGLETSAVLNFVSMVIPAISALTSANKTTLAQLHVNKRLMMG